MLLTPTSSRPIAPSPRRPVADAPSRPAFTLIEILVVVAIIIILVAIAIGVGTQVKSSSAARSTHVTLKTLEGLMKDYLAAGNPEPAPIATSAWDSRYGATPIPRFAQTLDSSFTGTQAALATCSSDPVNWVQAFRANPEFAKKLSSLPQGQDAPINSTPSLTTILDAFGNPIRYVPYNIATRKEGYFQSAGPDGVFANENFTKVSPPPPYDTATSKYIPPPSDDLYSTDP